MVTFLLQLLINKDFNSKNSHDLKDRMSKIKINEQYHIVTADVKDIFTNIPVDVAIDVIAIKLHLVAE